MIERKKINNDAEINLITGMIVSDKFLRHILPLYQAELLKNSYSQIVARWCLDFYKKYEKAPFQTIQSIYASEQENLNPEIAESIKLFLQNLSNKYEDEISLKHYNADYHIDLSEKFLKKQSLEKLAEEIKGNLASDKIAEAESIITKYKRVSRITGEGMDVFEDKDKIISAFTEEDEELFCFPGDLGKAIGPFCRDDLIAIAGPAKSGKTWWLIWIAVLAVTNGLNVAYFCLEMTEKQMIRRIYQMLLGETKKRQDEPVPVPRFDEDGLVVIKNIHKNGVQASSAVKKARAMKKMIRNAHFKMICAPRFSLSSAQIETHLDNWESFDGFLPDIILIDYGDIVAPLDRRAEQRHQINEVWQWMAALAQKRHCVVVSPTHTGRATYNRDAAEGDVVEDIRKLNHVAGVISLNRSKEDKEKSLVRVNTWATRHEGDSPEVRVLQCLAIGKPCVDSRIKERV